MKNLNNTKKTVLAIGTLALLAGIVGLFDSESLMEQFLPLYSGFTLIGTVLLHKEKQTAKHS